MRLLNTESFEIKEFMPNRLPPYAILSHTWGRNEISFQDMQKDGVRLHAGWSKIENFCKTARESLFEWVWIDTCCIDKSSSAELSEAINSMFAWYRDAIVCYAYLEDVFWDDISLTAGKQAIHNDDLEEFDPVQSLRRSRWFKRGWTLQELLAPQVIEFYAQNWEIIGTKSSLAPQLSAITKINIHALRDGQLHNYLVAERMSWAADRETTRVEDRAYCLLGIFGVNMPLIYGEGPKAFERLQEEILKQIDDLTVLSWWSEGPEIVSLSGHIFASSPGNFRLRELYSNLHRDKEDLADSSAQATGSHSTMTNKGLHVRLPILRIDESEESWTILAYLSVYEHHTIHSGILENVAQSPKRYLCLRLSGKPPNFKRNNISNPLELVDEDRLGRFISTSLYLTTHDHTITTERRGSLIDRKLWAPSQFIVKCTSEQSLLENFRVYTSWGFGGQNQILLDVWDLNLICIRSLQNDRIDLALGRVWCMKLDPACEQTWDLPASDLDSWRKAKELLRHLPSITAARHSQRDRLVVELPSGLGSVVLELRRTPGQPNVVLTFYQTSVPTLPQ